MDTILNLGMNDEVVKVVEAQSGSKRFAYDSYRRFIQMFSDVVMGLEKSKFEVIIDEVKEKKGVKLDIDLDGEDMEELAKKREEENTPPPDPGDQPPVAPIADVQPAPAPTSTTGNETATNSVKENE
jgi:phosphoenolpyruvate synthase/pyruvate phosphate dikinase